MTPVRLIRRAQAMGIDIIAISDHNSAEHVEVAGQIASRHGITVLPAMEICSAEEVHILALFGDAASCRDVQEAVYARIPVIPSYRHDETSQPVVNEDDEILFFNTYPLINATEIPVASLIELIHHKGGLAIASHIDRESFSIISQLGFIPDDLPLDAVEVSSRVSSEEEARRLLPGVRYPIVSFSDAHHIEDVGRRVTEFRMERPTIDEIRLSLEGNGERGYAILFSPGPPH